MRVLHIVEYLDPSRGGPPMVAMSLAAAQTALGATVGLVAYDEPSQRQAIDTAWGITPGIDQVSLTVLPAPGRLERLTGHAASRAIEPLVSGADVVHLHGVWDPLLLVAARTARRCGIPYVVTPHGMLDPWSLSQSRIKKRIALMIAYRSMLNGATFVHALNDEERRLMGPLGLCAPSEVIANGIFPEQFEPRPARGCFRLAHPVLGEDPFVLFLSRLHFKKGLDYLADAFAILAKRDQRIRLVVAGPDGGARQAFEDQVRQSGLMDRVHLVGPVWGQTKYEAMVDAECFCLPSRQEGFSVAILEAMACGCPVVISEGCHFPQVAEAGAGRVTPLDPGAIAMALLDVLGQESARQRMGDAGRSLVCERYTWSHIARRSLEAYDRHGLRAKSTAGGQTS